MWQISYPQMACKAPVCWSKYTIGAPLPLKCKENTSKHNTLQHSDGLKQLFAEFPYILQISGTELHVDPDVTDAWNACISGSKWWVYLPKDLYEAKTEWSCDPACSPKLEVDLFFSGMWLNNFLPQIRYKNVFKDQFRSQDYLFNTELV